MDHHHDGEDGYRDGHPEDRELAAERQPHHRRRARDGRQAGIPESPVAPLAPGDIGAPLLQKPGIDEAGIGSHRLPSLSLGIKRGVGRARMRLGIWPRRRCWTGRPRRVNAGYPVRTGVAPLQCVYLLMI